MKYNIRAANLSDLEKIFNLQKDYEHLLISKDALKDDLNSNSIIYFVAVTDTDNILGAIGFSTLVDHIDISIVITKKELERNGIASSILLKLIEYSKNKNIETIFLEVRKSNSSAIKLYEKFDFKQISIRKSYYPDNNEDALIYMLKI